MVSTPLSSDVNATRPCSNASNDSRRAQHLSAVLEDLLPPFSNSIKGGIG
uniref:Uncharacterized protein n=1 Tax=Arundo donax TaxID=35708 RepID=A0A0A9F514_ARUDO